MTYIVHGNCAPVLCGVLLASPRMGTVYPTLINSKLLRAILYDIKTLYPIGNKTNDKQSQKLLYQKKVLIKYRCPAIVARKVHLKHESLITQN
jgi:hypothetical protein